MIDSRPNISVISINVMGNSPIKEKKDPQIKWEKKPNCVFYVRNVSKNKGTQKAGGKRKTEKSKEIASQYRR